MPWRSSQPPQKLWLGPPSGQAAPQPSTAKAGWIASSSRYSGTPRNDGLKTCLRSQRTIARDSHVVIDRRPVGQGIARDGGGGPRAVHSHCIRECHDQTRRQRQSNALNNQQARDLPASRTEREPDAQLPAPAQQAHEHQVHRIEAGDRIEERSRNRHHPKGLRPGHIRRPHQDRLLLGHNCCGPGGQCRQFDGGEGGAGLFGGVPMRFATVGSPSTTALVTSRVTAAYSEKTFVCS